MALLGFHCFVWAFSSCSNQGLLSIEVLGLLISLQWLLWSWSTGPSMWTLVAAGREL